MMAQVVMTNEIYATILSDSAYDKSALRADPKGYIHGLTEVSFSSDLVLSVVDNSADEVHLALPYYAGLDGIGAQELSMDDLGSVSAGEVFIGIEQRITSGMVPHLLTGNE